MFEKGHAHYPRDSKPLLDRFWKNVELGPNCWEWKGSTLQQGYGVISVGYKSLKAHRIAWSIAHGPIPDGLLVCHKCDNPPCVRPDHLFLGTHADNHHDRDRKGRGKWRENFKDRSHCRGEYNGSAKLTWSQVNEIRAKYKPVLYSQKKLAEEYHVSPYAIFAILKRHTWAFEGKAVTLT